MTSSSAAASAAALLLLPLLAAAGDEVCPRQTVVCSILQRASSACPAADSPLGLRARHFGVVELSLTSCFICTWQGDDGALQKAVALVLQNKDDFVAILFYASWCPFSKIFRTDFQKLSSFFPTIAHFSFEETRIKPRMLSRYGIRAFPTLFLVNSTVRVRYHGSRTMNSLAMFYKNVTGINAQHSKFAKLSRISPFFFFFFICVCDEGMDPMSVDVTSLEKMADTINIIDSDKNTEQEDSLLVWARSPERLLHQDTCLALASSFLLLRLLHFLIPKVNACVKQAWRMRLHELNRVSWIVLRKVMLT
ncbi:hypothetical protein PR202_gb03322 [Eleusine coracana subsp. coracana]|uniref:Thioredoxin domain-containing protein n=1 Tax=Eleusine coracana subsp. coracana TaxID=191504 RepID=A0AAV5E019_ELECO|nr:hypothetical protein PR202_gb03242 [Eleusine coracana subsp. coracana]GJN16344.1 hypothetical protein PR202_gb03322 [Eleusine coracana subsp. coracana]